MVLTGQKYLCKNNWLLFAWIFVPAKKAYSTKLSKWAFSRESTQANKPQSQVRTKYFQQRWRRKKVENCFFFRPWGKWNFEGKSGADNLQRAGTLVAKYYGYASQARKKGISGGDRWQRPVSFQLFARLSLIADNPPSTSPKFCGHLR